MHLFCLSVLNFTIHVNDKVSQWSTCTSNHSVSDILMSETYNVIPIVPFRHFVHLSNVSDMFFVFWVFPQVFGKPSDAWSEFGPPIPFSCPLYVCFVKKTEDQTWLIERFLRTSTVEKSIDLEIQWLWELNWDLEDPISNSF